jgi:hypothetical protein
LLQGFLEQSAFQIRTAVFVTQPQHAPGFFRFPVQIERRDLPARIVQQAEVALQSPYMQVEQADLQQQTGAVRLGDQSLSIS